MGAPWDLFPRIWAFLNGIWSKNGCSIDPFGCPKQNEGTASGSNKNGCTIDPSGGCASLTVGSGSSTTSENGGSLDPSG
jgi:hypothetical protein